MTLTEFLLARIAEDEASARSCVYETPWSAEPTDDSTIGCVWSAERELVVETIADDARHIARWDPARVLAECEAKRRIVEKVRDSYKLMALDWPKSRYVIEIYKNLLNDLASPYADHPDFPGFSPDRERARVYW